MKKYKITPLGKFVISIVVLFVVVIVGSSIYNFFGFGKKTSASVGKNDTTKTAIGLKAEADKEPKDVIVKKPTPKPTSAPAFTPTPMLKSTPEPTSMPEPTKFINNKLTKSSTLGAVTVNKSKAIESENHAIFALKDILSFVPSNIETKETKEKKKTNVEIFYIPHPDDELLSMGVAIADSVKRGKEVHLVLFTHGYESNAIKIINGEIYCNWHKKVHNPKLEGYDKLTEKEFGKYRGKEFVSSAICLGVNAKNIHIMNFYEDSVTPYEVKLVMLGFEKQFPDAVHNAASYQDKHPFHKKIGNALLELYKSKEVKTAHFFISPVQWSSISGETILNEQLAEKVKKSIEIYKLWKPENEQFGIGYHSYQTPFDHISRKIISKYHNPSN